MRGDLRGDLKGDFRGDLREDDGGDDGGDLRGDVATVKHFPGKDKSQRFEFRLIFLLETETLLAETVGFVSCGLLLFGTRVLSSRKVSVSNIQQEKKTKLESPGFGSFRVFSFQ